MTILVFLLIFWRSNALLFLFIDACNCFTTDSSSNLVPGCLTWEKQGRNLNLICKLNNDKTSVSIIDPQGNHRGYCNIHSKGLNCHATFTGENVEFEVNMMQIVLSVPLNQHPDDGEWVCHQGKSSYTTTVNIEEGTFVKAYIIKKQ